MALLTEHLAETFVVAGLLLLAVEILVLGFSTFVLLFVGLAALVTGVLMYSGLLAEEMFSALGCLAVLSVVLALLLWKPMKRMQGQTERKTVTSDLVGHRFYLSDALQPGKTIEYRYSGITWQVSSRQAIDANREVQVMTVDVGRFEVMPVGED